MKTFLLPRAGVLAIALALSPLSPSLFAQHTPVRIDQQNSVRRQEDLVLARQLVRQGELDFKDKKFEAAYTNFLDALDKIGVNPAADPERQAVVQRFCVVALAYANNLVQNGRYADAEKVAKTILLPQFNPQYKPAVQFLSHLEQPGYFNKTVTPQFAADRDQVNKYLIEADGFYATGRYDLAIKRYEQVLLIDPYNNAARMGMERVNQQKTGYYNNAYNETRSRMLWQVDRAWERPIKKPLASVVRSTSDQDRLPKKLNTDKIRQKLKRIVIPKLPLDNATLKEAVDLLKQKSRDLDTVADGTGQTKGVNIVIRLGAQTSTPAADTKTPPSGATAPVVAEGPVDAESIPPITLSLTNVPLMTALDYITQLAGLKYKIEEHAVIIVPMTENTEELETRKFTNVDPSFVRLAADAEPQEQLPAAGEKTDADKLSTRKASKRPKLDAVASLKAKGINFPRGATASYDGRTGTLSVHNTVVQLDYLGQILEEEQYKQAELVEIQSKFVEIAQHNLDELGFDWTLGPLSLGGGVYGTGGSEGFGQTTNSETYPFNTAGTSAVTGGLRTGVGNSPYSAVSMNSIDALLAGVGQGAVGAAPSVLGFSGIFSNVQFQAVIRALSQKKGTDIMSAPTVTTQSGHDATIEVIRKFPYPTEYDAPQIPQAETGGLIIAGPSQGSVMMTAVAVPATPTTFEEAKLGVTLQATPTIQADKYTIDMKLLPRIKVFDGFVNYGSPINSWGYSSLLVAWQETELTTNAINQPIFSNREVQTNFNIWDNSTIAIGGLISEEVQKTQDKVPILGDIPLAGRLFRSNVDQKIKKNLIVFVSVRIMDYNGNPLIRTDEQEEAVDLLGLPETLPPPNFENVSFGK